MIFKKISTRIFYVVVLLTACAADKNASTSIEGFDYANLQQVELEHPLKEISGIAFQKSKQSFLVINDEEGIVYVLDPKTFRITDRYDFGEEGDYEEIQVIENIIYVLRSDGTIYKMKLNGIDMPYIETFEYAGVKAEYESFYIDALSNTIVLIPKHSKIGTKDKQTITYTINNSDGIYADKKEHTLLWSSLKKSSMLHPSAVSVHPISKEIYLLASIEKKLLVLNADWKLLAEYELDKAHFQQPEGITFDAEGNLYITNEAGEESPTLIKIPILPN